MLCKLARANESPNAAIAATALLTAHDQRPVELARAPAAPPPTHLPNSRKALAGFPQVAAMPDCPAELSCIVIRQIHLIISITRVPVAAQSGHWVACRKRL